MLHPKPKESKHDFLARALKSDDLKALLDSPEKREAFITSIWNRAQKAKPSNKEWYTIKAQDDEAEILLYDDIGEGFYGGGTSARSFVEDLRDLRNVREINVRINSRGGDVFEGLAMYNALSRHPARIVVDIDGLAGSIASVIALAGDSIRMAQNGYFFIHNPFGAAIGTAEDMRVMAEALGKIQSTLVETYEDHSRLSAPRIQEFMDQETWFTASEALTHKFIDEVTEGQQMAASVDLSLFHNVPEQAKALAAGRQRSGVDLQQKLKDMREHAAKLEQGVRQ